MPRFRPPWYYGWTIVAVAMTYQAIIFGIAIYSFTFWVPLWEEEFAVGRGDIMLIFISIQAGMAVLAPFAGRAADSLPIRWMVLTGSILFAAGLVLSSYAQALWQIGLIFTVSIVAGLVLAGPITALTLVARWFNRNSGMAMGIVSTGTSIGGLLVPLLMVYLQGEFGWREANLWLAALVVLVIAPMSLLLYDSPADAGLVLSEASGPAAAALHGSSGHPEWTVRNVLRAPSFWTMMFCFTVVTAIFVAVHQNMASLAKDSGISAVAVSSAVAIMASVMIGAKLLFGFLADRRELRTLYLVAIGALLAALLLLGLVDMTYPILMLVAALIGVATGSVMPLLAAMIRRDFGPLSFGRVKGLSVAVLSCSAIGPWVAGSTYDATGSYNMAWLFLGLLLLPAVVVSSGLSSSGPRGRTPTVAEV